MQDICTDLARIETKPTVYGSHCSNRDRQIAAFSDNLPACTACISCSQ